MGRLGSSGMVDSLSRVDWSALRHAYGPATDVPADLRLLASPEPGDRESARYALWGSIYHQGSVYPATEAAVPVLLDLLGQPTVADKDGILELVAGIARGYGDEPGLSERIRSALHVEGLYAAHAPEGDGMVALAAAVARAQALKPAADASPSATSCWPGSASGRRRSRLPRRRPTPRPTARPAPAHGPAATRPIRALRRPCGRSRCPSSTPRRGGPGHRR